MDKIIELKYIDEYKLWIRFNDGESKIIDFKNFIGKGISSILIDIEYFKLVTIDNGGGIEWPNGFDFCPNYLKEFVDSTENVYVRPPHLILQAHKLSKKICFYFWKLYLSL